MYLVSASYAGLAMVIGILAFAKRAHDTALRFFFGAVLVLLFPFAGALL
jgi:hypothetical protein